MDPVNIRKIIPEPYHFEPVPISSLSTRLLAVAGLILFGIGAAGAALLQRKYDGGIMIRQPDFSALKPVIPQIGPFLSDEHKCHLQKFNICPTNESLSVKTLLFGSSEVFEPVKATANELASYVRAVEGSAFA